MAKLTVVSGVGGKLPAAFLLDIAGRRILLDLGEGPEPGVRPDLSGIGRVDAICLSHAHIDHAGALDLSAALGDPPVWATETTWLHIPQERVATQKRRTLPVRGAADIDGLPVTLGRNGHAPGGVWFHFAHDGGFLYTGDWSVESSVLPFDPPPPAGCVVTDASYGDRDASLEDQIGDIAGYAATGAVVCVPSGGRGPEMTLGLAHRGLRPLVCPVVHAEIAQLAGDVSGLAAAGMNGVFARLLADLQQPEQWQPDHIVVAAEANLETGLSAELFRRRSEGFRFLLSGHVPDGTPAEALLREGDARWMPWNVHPRFRDILHLADLTGARRIVPAFVAANDAPRLWNALGDRIALDRETEFGVSSKRYIGAAS